MRHDYTEFVKRDVEVVVVGLEDAGAFADHSQKESLPFIGLPDPTHSVLKLYGQEVKLFKLGRMPAQALIDKAGVARFAHYGHDMKDIPGNEEILALAAAVNAAADAQTGDDVVAAPPATPGGIDDQRRKHRDT